MKHAVRVVLVSLFANIFLGSMFSCNMYDCGELNSLSPEEILSNNDYVLSGVFASIDTLVVLGSFDYLNSESKFLIVEYRFHPAKIFKGKNVSNVYLWNCESVRMKDNYSTVLKLKASEQVLVYGKEMNQPEDLIYSMAPITFLDDLKNSFEGRKISRIRWNSFSADSLIALTILNNDSLQGLLKLRNLNGRTISGTDRYLWTLHEFHEGNLCYYDRSGLARTVSRKQYTESLEALLFSQY